MPAANSNIANPALWIWDKMKRPGCDTGITSHTLELLKAGAAIEPKPKRGQLHVGKGSTRTTKPTMIPYQTFRKLVERLRRIPECGMTENREWLSPTLRLRTRPARPQRRRANNNGAVRVPARAPGPAPKHKRKTAPSRLERKLRHGTLAAHRSQQTATRPVAPKRPVQNRSTTPTAQRNININLERHIQAPWNDNDERNLHTPGNNNDAGFLSRFESYVNTHMHSAGRNNTRAANANTRANTHANNNAKRRREAKNARRRARARLGVKRGFGTLPPRFKRTRNHNAMNKNNT